MRSRNKSVTVIRKIESNLPWLYRGVWHLMTESGLRIGDALSIRRRDIDSRGYLHYTAQKTGKRARVKLSDGFLDEYVRSRKLKLDSYIFPSPAKAGQPVTRQAVWKNVKRVCKELKIPAEGISPHTCRKYYATKVYEDQGLGAAMNALNHSSPETTFLYIFDENPMKDLEPRVRTLEKKLDRVLYAVDKVLDQIIGDDRYNLTPKALKILKKKER